jgi:hypothetical protein
LRRCIDPALHPRLVRCVTPCEAASSGQSTRPCAKGSAEECLASKTLIAADFFAVGRCNFKPDAGLLNGVTRSV